MDYQPPSVSLNSPAHLLVGTQVSAQEYATSFLKKVLCRNHATPWCTVCALIDNGQHHAATWFSTPKSYTKDDLDPLFNRIMFTLQPDEWHFFIIMHAERLSLSVANSLLKSLEEPPAGYIFLLHTPHPTIMLPTIQSRCMTTLLTQTSHQTDHPLIRFFLGPYTDHPSQLLKLLEETDPSEQETATLFEELLRYWQQAHQRAHVDRLITIMSQPIAPNSSKLAWKELYLQLTSC